MTPAQNDHRQLLIEAGHALKQREAELRRLEADDERLEQEIAELQESRQQINLEIVTQRARIEKMQTVWDSSLRSLLREFGAKLP